MASLNEILDSARAYIGNDILLAIGIFIAGILISRFVHYFLQTKMKKLVEKTKTDVDDIILATLEKPLEYLIVVVGLYLALISVQAFVSYQQFISDVFFVIGVLLVANAVQGVFSAFIPRWIHVEHKKHEKSPQIISRMLSLVVYFIALLIILGYFHIEITPMIAALGIGGLAIGLALQDGLSNFFAGVYIISGSPIRIGDFIEIPSEKISGFVEDIRWRAAKIRTLSNTIVIVPNSKLSQSIVVNTYLPEKETAVLVECGVSYASDLEKVEKITTEVATHIQKTVDGAVKTFKPFIRYHTFGDSNINFTVILRVEEYTAMFLIKHEFIKALKKRFDGEGIEISFPVRNVYFRSRPARRT
ncbi:MAG: mechanosensitive ion channel family protein [Candidatus Micrarchaeota archaeon]